MSQISSRLDSEYSRLSNSQSKIVFVQYASPACYPPLEHMAELLLERGTEVEFFGLQISGDAAALSFPAALQRRTRTWAAVRPGFGQKMHYIAFCCRAIWLLLQDRPRWIYASDAITGPVAWGARLVGTKVAYHEHDSPSTATGLFARVLHRVRRRVLETAELVIFPNECRLKLSTVKRPAIVVWNLPRREEAIPAPRADFGAETFDVLFHGSIVAARLPLTVLGALASLPEHVRLHIVGYVPDGARSYFQQFLAEAEALNVRARVIAVGPIPGRRELLEYAARCHAGLALTPLESADQNAVTLAGASNKPFDYLACGLPVLVTDTKEWRELIVMPGFGNSCDPRSAQSISAALAGWVNAPNIAWEAGERGRQRVRSDWNYETAAEPVLRVLTSQRA